MALLRRILWFLHPFRWTRRRGYGREILYAGWVNLPKREV